MPQHLNKQCYGVTGTRNPPTEAIAIVDDWIATLPACSTIYHGACVGIDAIVARAGWRCDHKIIAVVPANHMLVDHDAWKRWSHFVIHAPKGVGRESDYRARNKLLVHQIYQEGGLLKAFWTGNRHSGTYMTINIAGRVGTPVEIERI